MKKVFFNLFLPILLFQGVVNAQQTELNSFYETADKFAGIYQFNDGHRIIIKPHPDLEVLSIYDMTTGDVRPLEQTGDHLFVYGPNILSTSPIEGRISFKIDRGIIKEVVWNRSGYDPWIGYPVEMDKEEIIFINSGTASLSGWLMTPPGSGPFPIAVVPGPGMTDRYKLWRVAMSLIAEGIGVLVYDKRNVGKSAGDPLSDHYYTRSMQHAEDLKAAIRFVINHRKTNVTKIGVVGWSQTGWLSAISAADFDNLAFFVNIAGNSNPGWEQNQWYKISDLRFEEFSEREVKDAREFLDVHFDLMHKKISWEDYREALSEDSFKSWFKYLEDNFRYLWESEEEAYNYAAKEQDNIKANDFRKVNIPTLGLFFEYDESSPPDTPTIFLESRLQGKNDNVTIRVFPNTSHEGFIVSWYPTNSTQSEITRIEPKIFHVLQSWIKEQIQSQ